MKLSYTLRICEQRNDQTPSHKYFLQNTRRRILLPSDILFHTKGDYYDHREREHGEIKRYGRQWKDKLVNSTTQQPKCLGKEFAEASTRRENKICPQDTLVDKSHVNTPAGSSNTFNTRVNTAKPTRSRKNKYPRRSWAYVKENQPPENAVMYSMFSQNITKVDNGNVQMYICNMKSKSELQAVLRSINF